MPEKEELKAIRGLLDQARERIDRVLAQAETLHMRWRCLGCGYMNISPIRCPRTLRRPARNAAVKRSRQVTKRNKRHLFREKDGFAVANNPQRSERPTCQK